MSVSWNEYITKLIGALNPKGTAMPISVAFKTPTEEDVDVMVTRAKANYENYLSGKGGMPPGDTAIIVYLIEQVRSLQRRVKELESSLGAGR